MSFILIIIAYYAITVENITGRNDFSDSPEIRWKIFQESIAYLGGYGSFGSATSLVLLMPDDNNSGIFSDSLLSSTIINFGAFSVLILIAYILLLLKYFRKLSIIDFLMQFSIYCIYAAATNLPEVYPIWIIMALLSSSSGKNPLGSQSEVSMVRM
jgi:hypothetical protein